MKRIVISLAGAGLAAAGLAGIVVAQNDKKSITLDVACDCRTFKYNRDVPFEQVVRGDGFITNGKIFPGGTLPSGTQNNDPNDPGSIGAWVCRGTAAVGAAEAQTPPIVFFTQYHMMGDGRTLISEGFDAPAGQVTKTALVGGINLGALAGIGGELSAEIIGTNITGCPNIRFTVDPGRAN
ncbi:MAG: hypothetical protein ACKV2U_25095 [Bryobacteraceae bacterium]